MSDLRHKNYKKALAELLRAVEQGWLDSQQPKPTIGSEAGKRAVQGARELITGKREGLNDRFNG